MPIYRPTWAEISPTALLSNLAAVKKKAGASAVLAVVKADAYGHSADIVAPAIESDVAGFGVATVEEGLRLRSSGIKKQILVLGSLWPFSSFRAAARARLTPTISSVSGLEALEKTAVSLGRRLPFFLKIDTGMGRIGVWHEGASSVIERISCSRAVKCAGIYSHFASADFDDDYTRLQYERFLAVKNSAACRALGGVVFSMANSAGIFFFPRARFDMVRPGISLYGLQPSSEKSRALRLSPAMTWKTKIVYLKKIPRGASVSYSRRFVARRPSLVATLPVGYADGYRVAFSGRSQTLVRGLRAPVAGRVTMDMTMLDVTDVPGVCVGDEAVLLGAASSAGKSAGGRRAVTAEELASLAGTINYEITCGISARVPRVRTK